ncbi:histidine kinase [Photobacterium sp. SDRW27]|uniref:type II secretion system protein n=1 Tax=Photobacterium obscurum TaxID=2829490 RepID=UPI002243BEEA|nr:histidine kinase [Photobacterium obscurum]MCW8329839.1 histidine kinase [Photobacterium obscurum]
MFRLVTAIVILAILSITAYMKMLNFQSEARRATLKTIVATIHSVSGITYTKSLIRGTASVCSYSDGPKETKPYIEDIYICYGYPTAHIDNIIRAFDINEDSLYVRNSGSNAAGRIAYIHFGNKENYNDKCKVTYYDAKHIYESTNKTTLGYKVELEDSGC